MLKENPRKSGQADMFRSRLDSIIDLWHELVRMAGDIDWSWLERDLSAYYCLDNGWPGYT